MTAFRVRRLTAPAGTNVGVNSSNAGLGESQITRSSWKNNSLVVVAALDLGAGGGGGGIRPSVAKGQHSLACVGSLTLGTLETKDLASGRINGIFLLHLFVPHFVARRARRIGNGGDWSCTRFVVMTMEKENSIFDAGLAMCTNGWYINTMELGNDRELSG
jgi:hypothetical protein